MPRTRSREYTGPIKPPSPLALLLFAVAAQAAPEAAREDAAAAFEAAQAAPRPAAPARPALQDPVVFRSRTVLRTMFVAVTDQKDRPVRGLSQADFVLHEDGVQKEITYFLPESERAPIDVLLLVDSSASMLDRERLSRAQRAARGFVRGLKPEDRAQIADFNDTVRFRTEMTGDRSALALALERIEPGGSTALYNALYEVLRAVAAPSRDGRQRTIVVLSDGRDTSSLMEYDLVRAIALNTPASVYAIVAKGKDSGWRELFEIAEITGGRALSSKNFRELDALYERISEELSSKYLVGYYPEDDRAGSRVEVKLPARPELRVRATRAVGL